DAARAAPDQPEAHYNLGVLAEWQGRVDAARGHYEDALRARPAFGPAVLAIGHLLMRRDDVEAALRLARDQLARAPKSADLRNAYNRLRLTAGRDAAQVEADSKDILRVDEKNVDAMINLAAASHANGKYELAIAILENAKALDPDDPEIHARQAMAHAALGEQLKARFVLEEATALPGGATAEIYNNLGLIYHEAGDYIGAELQFRKALARWPDMLGARINLGNALKGQQRYADADAVLRAALADHPRSPEVAYNLGILYLDGALPDLDPITRLERALAFFESYKQTSGARERDDPVDAYIGEARKRIEVERKKAEMGRRAPKDEPKGPDPAPEAEVPPGGEEK
ncbi:MAG: tetratricopeptide repeat protein, partial [Myxococcales bacterium]|nr:tetratricopeptide repeat protein [Myxococcales bacterium]